VVPIGLGTPTQWYTVALDTSSDMTWVQCEWCYVCLEYNFPVFWLDNSSTYADIPCKSPYCSDLDDTKVCSPNGNCAYLEYTDYTSTPTPGAPTATTTSPYAPTPSR